MIPDLRSRLTGLLSSRFPPFPGAARRLVLVSAALFCLCGCGPRRMQVDFKGYESAYADTSNRELLLNLARLENRDPTYFFKLGQITSSYRMQASLVGAGNLTSSSTGVQVPTGGGTPGGLYENDPVFQFIPVNDDTNAQLLLKPIPAETFYILYQQGWRVDQLFRLMVDRIEIARWDAATQTCRVQILNNQPPPIRSGDPDYTTEGYQLSSFVTFLRVSAAVYDLQKQGMLLLRLRSQFVPFGTNADLAGKDGASISKTAPQAKDQNEAVAKNNLWQKNASGNWVLGQKQFTPVFFLSPQKMLNGTMQPDLPDISSQITSDLPELAHGMAVEQALAIVANGFSIEGDISPKSATEDLCPGKVTTSHLVLRSMIGLMAAAAQEQLPFQNLLKTDPVIPPSIFDKPGTSSGGRFHEEVPVIEQLPLLQLLWDNRSGATSPKTLVSYRNKTYLVADPGQPIAPEDQYWNRDMFRLIGYLTSQVTVDISKFPLPEILQFHTD